MSDTIEKTPEQVAVEQAAANQAAYVEKLKSYEGKTFTRNDGRELPTTVLGYAGTRIHQEIVNGKPQAVNSHVFLVEASDGRRWTPAATQFLKEHTETTVAKTEASIQPI